MEEIKLAMFNVIPISEEMVSYTSAILQHHVQISLESQYPPIALPPPRFHHILSLSFLESHKAHELLVALEILCEETNL